MPKSRKNIRRTYGVGMFKSMKKGIIKCVFILMICAMCSSMMVLAQTVPFDITLSSSITDSSNIKLIKQDNETMAYVTITSISGNGTIWIYVVDAETNSQCTAKVPIRQGDMLNKKILHYYPGKGQQGREYCLVAFLDMSEIHQGTYQIKGRFTP